MRTVGHGRQVASTKTIRLESLLTIRDVRRREGGSRPLLIAGTNDEGNRTSASEIKDYGPKINDDVIPRLTIGERKHRHQILDTGDSTRHHITGGAGVCGVLWSS